MVCPKCGAPIKRFDLSPNCKQCGVHILYYSQQTLLAEDAKRTELEFASARVFVAKLKAAYLKGGVAISRMIFCILTIAVTFIPLGTVKFSIPYFEEDITIGTLGLYKIYSDGLFGLIPDFISSKVGGSESVMGMAAVVLLVLCVLLTLADLLTILLSFTNIKRTSLAQAILTIIAAVCAAGSEGLIIAASMKDGDSPVVSVSEYWWALIIVIAVFAVYIGLNFNMYKHPPVIPVSEVDQKRIELKKKIKHGEVSYDDLPVPIFETEEEKLKRENALAGAEKKKKDKKKKKEAKVDE